MARAKFEAELMLLMCGYLRSAAAQIEEVISKASLLPLSFQARAYMERGRLAYSRDEPVQALEHLKKAKGYLATELGETSDDLSRGLWDERRLAKLEKDRHLAVTLAETFHFIGVSFMLLVTEGYLRDPSVDLEQAKRAIDLSRRIHEWLGDEVAVAQELLELAVPEAHLDSIDVARTSLHESAERIGPWSFIEGAMFTAWGNLHREQSLDHFEIAVDAYRRDALFPIGASRTLREMSLAEQDSDPNRAFRHAVASAVLHPYKRNLIVLCESAGHLSARQTGPRGFPGLWKDAMQDLRANHGGEFVLVGDLAWKLGSGKAARRSVARSLKIMRNSVTTALRLEPSALR